MPEGKTAEFRPKFRLRRRPKRRPQAEAVIERAGTRFLTDRSVQKILEATPDSRRILREFLDSQKQKKATQGAEVG